MSSFLFPLPQPLDQNPSPPPNNLQHTHETQRIRLNPHNLEPSIRLPKDFLPRLHRPLLGVKQRHHAQIRRRAKPTHTARQILTLDGILLTHIIDKQDARTGLERRDEGTQDSDGFGVGPVMQDPFEHVDVRNDGLGIKEVVSLKTDAIAKVGWEFAGKDGGDLGEILDDDVEVWKGAGEDSVVVAGGAAEVDDGDGGALGGPVEGVEDEGFGVEEVFDVGHEFDKVALTPALLCADPVVFNQVPAVGVVAPDAAGVAEFEGGLRHVGCEGLLSLAEAAEGFGEFEHWGTGFVEDHLDEGGEAGVFGEGGGARGVDYGGGGWCGFGEEAHGDCVVEDAVDDFDGEVGVFCDFFKGGGSVYWDGVPEVELVEDVEAGGIWDGHVYVVVDTFARSLG